MNETIFISISACNEKDLLQTVVSAINNSDNPNRLSFGIFEQSSNNNFTNFSNVKHDIIHIKAICDGPLGVGLPRLNASLLTERNKNFLLQIDAHMIFEKHWDTDLIKYYSLISQNNDKVIISTYVPWWYEDNFGNIKLSTDESYLVDPNNFLGINNVTNGKIVFDDYNNHIFRLYPGYAGKGITWIDQEYEEHFGITAHFMFTDFRFIENIPHDPFVPWGADEILAALRAWTRGYKIFTIPKPIVWHKNKWGPTSTGIGTIALDKNDWRIHSNWSNKKMFDIHGKNLNLGIRKIKDALLGNYVGFWGAPNKELLKQYEVAVDKNFEEYYTILKEHLIQNNNSELLRILYE